MSKLKLDILFPLYCTGSGVSYTCLSLARAMRRAGSDAIAYMCAADRELAQPALRTAVPGWLKRPVYRMFPSQSAIRAWTEFQFIQQVRPGSTVYLWPGVSRATYCRLKDKGCTIIVERINCHRATARGILDEAYRHCGLSSGHGIADAAIEEETRKLLLADFIFSPSPMVRCSLEKAGIAPDVIIDTSYGWDPDRHTPHDHVPSTGFTVLFVGRLCVRKGVHLLLEAWRRAAIPGGRLVMAGFLEPEIERLCTRDLTRSDVVLPGFVRDIAQLYAAADVFVFPSLEEGGPQVTYEAMACGLPVVVSPMGAGAVARNGLDGYVCPPYDIECWADTLRMLAINPALCIQLGAAGRSRAEQFIWDCVGSRRLEALVGSCTRGHHEI
jgi:glycosyltransferase involved in cell wall biosynthesis